MFITNFVILFCFAILIDYLLKRRRYNITANIPGPKIYPLIGNLLFLTQKKSEDVVQNIIEYTKIHGPFVRAWGGHQIYVVTIDPKGAEVILSSPKCITKGSMYSMVQPWLGDGLLLSTGYKWHQRRKIITPSFHFKILEEFVEVFDQQSQILIDKLIQHVNGGVFDIHPYVAAAALDIIAETAMSTKLNAQSDPNSEYVQAVAEASEIVMNRISNIIYKSDLLFNILGYDLAKRLKKALNILHTFTETIIKKRRQSLLQQNGNIQNNRDEDDIGIKRRTTFLDILLQSTVDGKPLSDHHIREEVDTFMFEGHDTTAAGLAFSLYCISRHPDVQVKLFTEIRQVFGDDRTESTNIRKLNDLKYMDLVIKECLRLYPSVPLIARTMTEDTKVHNYTIPVGADVIIPLFVVLKNPQVFPDPEMFRPERHSLENIQDKPLNPFVNVPFSAGPRNCIGQKFAMLELKCTISKVLRHFELLPMGEEPQIEMNLILRSKNGVQLGIKPRIY